MAGRAPRYQRYSARIKSDHDISDDLRVGQSMFYSRGDRINQTSRHDFALVTYTLRMMPIASVYDEDNVGGYGSPPAGMEEENALNPIGANNLLESYDDINRYLGNVWGEYDILENLTYKLNISYDTRNVRNEFFEPHYNLGVFFTNNTAKLTENTFQNTQTLIENTLNYQNDFGDHSVDVLIGYTEERNDYEVMEAHAEGYTKPYFKVLDAGTENITIQGSTQGHNLRSYLGRLEYNFDDRYLLTASVRRDGSSRFAAENRYGVFPSASVGWRISEEEFFEVPHINNLKLRGEYGILGNQEIGNYQYQASINTSGVHYNFGNTLAPGAIQTELANTNIKWEENVTGNIGVDLTMFDNRFQVTAEYYYSETQDLLLGVPIPPSVGSTVNPTVNAASLKNSGVELDVSYSNVIDDLSYSVDANVATVNNEVLSLGGGEPIFGAGSRTAVGSEVGELYGYVRDGLFQEQSEINNVPPEDSGFDTNAHAFQAPGTAPGDIRFKDLNDDGVINANDRRYLGSVIPDFTFGFGGNINYKSWNLAMRFTGQYGNKIYNSVRQQMEGTDLFWNYTSRKLDYWTPDNRDTNMPRPAYQDPNGNDRMSDRWVEDGSYIKLKNVQLGYSLPQDLLERFGLRSLQVNASVQNVFTITNYMGLDPALGPTGYNNWNDGLFSRGIDAGSYPHPRIYTVGIQLGI